MMERHHSNDSQQNPDSKHSDRVAWHILRECKVSTSRSSGPGGQNVNKVESKVELRWSLPDSTLAAETKMELQILLSSYLSKAFELIVTSDRFRDRGQNKKDAEQKLLALIKKVYTPKKKRKPTKKTRASHLKRLDSKKKHQEKKQTRQKIKL